MEDLGKKPAYGFGEEIANSVTHGIGILLAIIGLVVMLYFSERYGNRWHLVSCSIFGVTLVFSYTASTLYHSIPMAGPKRILRIFDHAAIYLLIAGTYTPFALISLRGPWGWSLFGTTWGLAITGILCKIFIPRKIAGLSTLLYIAMGWVVVIAARPMLTHVEPGGLILLLAGGLAYTGGVIFYAWERMPYNHMVWHLFVMAGSTLHFFAILLYVIPGPAGV
ncbi:PAQR family membrane homeostasis protein TrhA [Geopsychrobacter electrodiphilus]|uniref:PAQR family membrane homeostasis protein TrhA n=1 Tax=Geopsychrobacter electrodiphilus TaxID=225196 RepID=UPI0003797819|nr:hemolysin III family protein [Geopsychrobacter electrodiphilus]